MSTVPENYMGAAIKRNSILPSKQLTSMQAMLDATPDCISILTVDGTVLEMNKAGCVALGLCGDSKFGMPWLSLLPPDVAPLGQEALLKAAQGENARFSGHTDSNAGIYHWDNILSPIKDENNNICSIICVSRDVTDLRVLNQEREAAIAREKLFAQEMQHRIKNLFSVVTVLINIAEKEAIKGEDLSKISKILKGKINALARASDVALFKSHSTDESLQFIVLSGLVEAVMKPYEGRFSVEGDHAAINKGNMTTLALFFHELATNSTKHGALGTDSGHIALKWVTLPQGIEITWSESGGPTVDVEPLKNGFGNEMIDRLISLAGWTIKRHWLTHGLITVLYLPNIPSDDR